MNRAEARAEISTSRQGAVGRESVPVDLQDCAVLVQLHRRTGAPVEDVGRQRPLRGLGSGESGRALTMRRISARIDDVTVNSKSIREFHELQTQ